MVKLSQYICSFGCGERGAGSKYSIPSGMGCLRPKWSNDPSAMPTNTIHIREKTAIINSIMPIRSAFLYCFFINAKTNVTTSKMAKTTQHSNTILYMVLAHSPHIPAADIAIRVISTTK